MQTSPTVLVRPSLWMVHFCFSPAHGAKNHPFVYFGKGVREEAHEGFSTCIGTTQNESSCAKQPTWDLFPWATMLTCTSVLCLAPGRRARPFPAEAGEPHWTYSSTQMILVRPSLVFSQSVKHSCPQKVLYPSVMPPLNHSLPPTSRGRRIKGKTQWVKVRRVYLKTTQRERKQWWKGVGHNALLAMAQSHTAVQNFLSPASPAL